MEVRGDGRHPWNAEVEWRRLISEAAHEREEESAHAGVHVTADPPLPGQGGQLRDGIDDTVRIARSGPNDENGVVRDGGPRGLRVGQEVLAHRDVDRLHP